MRKRNKAKRFEKKQVGEFDFVFERPASVKGLVSGIEEDLQKVDELISEFSELMGM